MKLVTVPVELAQKAAMEVAKETAKSVEHVTELGKAGNIAAVEHVNLGKLGTDEAGNQISFGSLANGRLLRDDRYLRWKDGISINEVDKKWIKELSNEISAIYGEDKIKVSKWYGLDNAGMYSHIGKLIYDPHYLAEAGNKYGMDTMLGTLAHEVGHRVVYNLGLKDEITPYENEACADYIAGLTARLCKLDSTHRLAWYNAGSEVSGDDIHPGKSVRIEAFTRGLDRIDRGPEATTLKLFEAFSPYDLEGVYQDADLLKKILYEDVITPLRSGEIKKV